MAKEPKVRLTKETVDARFAAKQEKNRQRRETKVTAEDIQKRLDDRRARRAEKVEPGKRARVGSVGLGIAMILCSGAAAVSTSTSTEVFTDQTRINEQLIASAKGDLASIPAADDAAAEKYSAELESQIAEATIKGGEVATVQQAFSTILSEGTTESLADGTPSTAFLDSVEHRKLLAPYFVAEALIVADDMAYAPGSVLPYDDNEIDPRYPWYVSYELGSSGRTVVNPDASGWELASIVATSDTGVLEATWLNKNASTGDLLAWATAGYFIDAGAFGGLIVGTTTLGEQGTPSTNAEGERV